jgi:hypothetical protein
LDEDGTQDLMPPTTFPTPVSSDKEDGTQGFLLGTAKPSFSSNIGDTLDESVIAEGSQNSNTKSGTQDFIPNATRSIPLAFSATEHTTATNQIVNGSESSGTINAEAILQEQILGEQDQYTRFFTGHNLSRVNESQIEKTDNITQLPFNMGRLPNASDSRNHAFHDAVNGNLHCSMIEDMTFIFTLGRKMPFYIDIICLVIGGIGILGNLATVAVVAVNLKSGKPYFLTILTLAVADLFCIGFKISTVFLEFEFHKYIE